MKNIIKSFFYKDDDFQPPYAWITFFCGLIGVSVILRFFQVSSLSDTLLLGMLGFVMGWIGFYNKDRKDREKENN